MKPMVFVRTRYLPENGRVRANLANTNLKRGSSESPYRPSLQTNENHLVAARVWILDHMPGVNSEPVGCQSYDNGYIYAFSLDA